MKRILILVDDQLIANFYREKFEAMALGVETVRTGDAALRSIVDKAPDLALIDPIFLPAGSGLETVERMRSALGDKPLMVFTSVPQAVAAGIMTAGVTKIVPRDSCHAQAVAAAVQTALELPDSPLATTPDDQEAWLKSALETTTEIINTIRFSMHAFIKEPQNPDLLFDIFRQVHNVSERASLVGLTSIYKITSAMEAFIYDLYVMPEQVNPSVIRTVSQSIDFLATLFDEKNVRRVQEPKAADVLVVDDEADSRQLIGAAMEMIHLKITCAAEAEMAMTILEDNAFDLIFLDINLPQTSGFDLCTQIRQIEEHRQTPIVFLTGMATFQNRAKSTLSGGSDFIGKPFNLLELGVKALTWIFKNQLGLN